MIHVAYAPINVPPEWGWQDYAREFENSEKLGSNSLPM